MVQQIGWTLGCHHNLLHVFDLINKFLIRWKNLLCQSVKVWFTVAESALNVMEFFYNIIVSVNVWPQIITHLESFQQCNSKIWSQALIVILFAQILLLFYHETFLICHTNNKNYCSLNFLKIDVRYWLGFHDRCRYYSETEFSCSIARISQLLSSF